MSSIQKRNQIRSLPMLRVHGKDYATYARALLDLTDVSMHTFQECILLGTVCFSDSNTKSEAQYFSVAARLAFILNLPNRSCENIWSSMGLGLPRQQEFVEGFPPPTDEMTFLALSSAASSHQISSRLIWSEMVMLARIWTQIHQLNQASVEGHIEPREFVGRAHRLAHELQSWADSLPPSLRENRENLERYARLGLGNAYGALPLGFRFYHEVLYYQFLPKNEHPGVKCTPHHCWTLDQCQCIYLMVSRMLVVTSSIYTHILLSSEDGEQVQVILTELQPVRAALDIALRRLQVFHDACIQSIDCSFCMDQCTRHGKTVAAPIAVSQGHATESADTWHRFLQIL
ncbi:hypothetical protein BDV23DRAFT_170890 [Aspergillus alliaceus]|uniref:Transcription factor domain-containing protein n=1 Tax=Petromyces alliaceus TaxID=209559 RepID=A0A5N7CEN4_PETAA|nr:hypothetical protein BDV23DRAFT_170890 [Aspergillus alliaceus]